MRVEEKAARGEQGDLRARDLAAARLPAQLGDGLAQVARALGAALGQAAAVRVHRHPALDHDPVLVLVPVVGQERPGLAGTAEPVALEAAQRHEADGGRVRRGRIGQDQLSELLLACERFEEVDADHIGRVARGHGRVQDPVPRVRRHDDQVRLG